MKQWESISYSRYTINKVKELLKEEREFLSDEEYKKIFQEECKNFNDEQNLLKISTPLKCFILDSYITSFNITENYYARPNKDYEYVRPDYFSKIIVEVDLVFFDSIEFSKFIEFIKSSDIFEIEGRDLNFKGYISYEFETEQILAPSILHLEITEY